jgi:hypothetical protein
LSYILGISGFVLLPFVVIGAFVELSKIQGISGEVSFFSLVALVWVAITIVCAIDAASVIKKLLKLKMNIKVRE